MYPQPLSAGRSWISTRSLGVNLTASTEPFLDASFRANAYCLRGRDRDLVVDTLMGLASLRAALPITVGKPLLAVATHVHLDHVGSLHEFADRAGARDNARGFAQVDDIDTFADAFRTLPDPVTALPHPGWSAGSYRIAPAPLTQLLDDGDVIDLGGISLTVIALPGHSPDSIGLFDEQDGVLFSGDAMHDGALLDRLRCSDIKAYRATMRRLRELPVRVVYGGHGAPIDGPTMRGIAGRYLDRTDR